MGHVETPGESINLNKKFSKEYCVKISKGNKGRKYIYNLELGQEKKVKPEEIQEYLSSGWLLGRLKNKKA